MNPRDYERHPREYTFLGFTSVVEALVGDVLRAAYGGAFSELISIMKDGVFYHLQAVGDRERVSRLFLEKVKNDQVDLEGLYRDFDPRVKKYEELIYQEVGSFSFETFTLFYRWYQELFPVAFTGMDSADFVDALLPEQRPGYIDWATKVRRRGELIYKDGEMKFIPRYTGWLAEKLPGYTPEELKFLLGRELNAYITAGSALPSAAELRERQRAFYVRQFSPGSLEHAAGDEALKIIEENNFLANPRDSLGDLTELKGQTAYPGLVTGRVRIIRTRQDMAAFVEGEIIVSPMTEPSYLPIMKRAAAFVTNEGGLLCHAAIVARELKKPCIVGTRIATAVLKDGDRVEVDAVSGIVRKLV
ncbi:MAG: Phosphoenolpyruvate synthase [Candidatus Magasanikbacteria bacterium GW2011_GWA2_56_11]|uniref:Phosphoenolpyruvate synthase n=1 Tax=Candidatus Magasanikbacteria bacterium GW2011_GWA2_56_11 TaxID=1619044 RepID=A0A0G2B875_9BACT|nr:MAG: Phosphoenolpyruvate synthase [Candidatus Magasanikbacteria bacterium GW2011_GWA2_56_11]